MTEKDKEFVSDLNELLRRHKRSLKVVTLGTQSWILSKDLVLSKHRLTTTKLKKLIEDDKKNTKDNNLEH